MNKRLSEKYSPPYFQTLANGGIQKGTSRRGYKPSLNARRGPQETRSDACLGLPIGIKKKQLLDPSTSILDFLPETIQLRGIRETNIVVSPYEARAVLDQSPYRDPYSGITLVGAGERVPSGVLPPETKNLYSYRFNEAPLREVEEINRSYGNSIPEGHLAAMFKQLLSISRGEETTLDTLVAVPLSSAAVISQVLDTVVVGQGIKLADKHFPESCSLTIYAIDRSSKMCLYLPLTLEASLEAPTSVYLLQKAIGCLLSSIPTRGFLQGGCLTQIHTALGVAYRYVPNEEFKYGCFRDVWEENLSNTDIEVIISTFAHKPEADLGITKEEYFIVRYNQLRLMGERSKASDSEHSELLETTLRSLYSSSDIDGTRLGGSIDLLVNITKSKWVRHWETEPGYGSLGAATCATVSTSGVIFHHMGYPLLSLGVPYSVALAKAMDISIEEKYQEGEIAGRVEIQGGPFKCMYPVYL